MSPPELPSSLTLPDGSAWTAEQAWIDGSIDEYIELATGRPVDAPDTPSAVISGV